MEHVAGSAEGGVIHIDDNLRVLAVGGEEHTEERLLVPAEGDGWECMKAELLVLAVGGEEHTEK